MYCRCGKVRRRESEEVTLGAVYIDMEEGINAPANTRPIVKLCFLTPLLEVALTSNDLFDVAA